MGNFYVNFTVHGSSGQRVVQALGERAAIVTPSRSGCVVAFDQEADSQDLSVLAAVGRGLSAQTSGPVLALLNHDDDVLFYELSVDGTLLDQYESALEGTRAPTGGDAALLCDVFGAGDVQAVAQVLGAPRLGPGGYLFAVQRHDALVRALHLSTYAVGFGYRDVSQGNLPDGLDDADLLWT